MALEIERKFEVSVADFKKLAELHEVVHIDQGYLILRDGFHTRVRICTSPSMVEASFASKVGSGMVRDEYEETISLDHAKILLKQSLRALQKQRIKVKHKGFVWDVDYFVDHGLAVAEIELPSEDAPFSKPEWAGKEVTGEKKFSNIRLAHEIK